MSVCLRALLVGVRARAPDFWTLLNALKLGLEYTKKVLTYIVDILKTSRAFIFFFQDMVQSRAKLRGSSAFLEW